MALSDDILKLLEDKDQRLTDVPLKYEGQLTKVQRRLFEELLLLMGQMDVKGGLFIISSQNLDLATRIATTLKDLIGPSGYDEVLAGFGTEFGVQARMNDDYFRRVFGAAISGDIMDSLKRGAVRQLAGDALEAPFITPIRQRLEQAVASGASLRDTIKILRVDINGGEVNGVKVKGKLSRYVKQIMTDTFAQSDRGYANQIAEDLDTEWRYYTRGTVDDSRDFCKERSGAYYHDREVQDWAKGKDQRKAGHPWQGMIKGTDKKTIFTNLGGWHCLHSVMPVSAAVVPLPVLRRNIKKGYFSPSKQERELLGL